MINDKDEHVAELILESLDTAINPSYVLQIVVSRLVIKDEQLSNKLHIAIARATSALLEHKDSRLGLAVNSLSNVSAYSKLLKLEPKARLASLLDICDSLFPEGELINSSENMKEVFEETIKALKLVIKEDNITSLNDLLESFWLDRRRKYITLIVQKNNLLDR